MLNLFLMFVVGFFALTGAAVLAAQVFSIEFGSQNYWNNHGLFFLVFISIFPRLTLLFSSVAFGGLLWWIGWIFAPRFLVAILATLAYWHQNPILVIVSWLIAIGGESSEKTAFVRRRPVVFHRTVIRRRAARPTGDVIDVTPVRRE